MEEKKVISIRENDGGIVRLESHESLSSTLSLAREYALEGYPDRYAVFSDKRIKAIPDGKGEVEYEEGLYLSIILRPSIFPSQASLLGAMSAAALVSALADHTSARLGLGWVSDLYCEGVKIGNASVEGKLDNYTTYEYIIVTFSVKLNKKHFPPRLTDMVRKVFESENTSIAMIIARNLLSRFFAFYSKIKSPAGFMEVYADNFALRGVKIRKQEGDKRRVCKVLGINMQNGALIVERRGGSLEELSSPRGVIIPKKIKLKKQDKQRSKKKDDEEEPQK